MDREVPFRHESQNVQLGEHVVGPGQPIYVIAEAGVNHDSDPKKAEDLVHAAKEAGANAVKFQIFTADRLAASDAPCCDYQNNRAGASRSQSDLLRSLELSPQAFADLKALALRLGIDFLATPFGLPDLNLLAALDPVAIKVASPDIVNTPLLTAAAGSRLPLIASTGASTIGELDYAVELITKLRPKRNLILLHCVSAYPLQPAEARLACIGTLAGRYGVPVGFSDHTPDAEFSGWAVSACACILEKHLTLSRTSTGPDHFFSLEPNDFARYVSVAHAAFAALGSGVIQPSTVELEVRRLSRGSLVAARFIPRGAVITPNDLLIQRPGTGMTGERWEQVIGHRSMTDIPAGAQLCVSMLRAAELEPSSR